jgi:DNA-binding CsgD family transcriptional regulator
MDCVDGLGELPRVLLRLVSVSCRSDAVFCYVEARADALVMQGAMAVEDSFTRLLPRPADQIFGDATTSDEVNVMPGRECRKLLACLPGAENFVDSYVLYFRQPGQGRCVCGVRYEPALRVHHSLPARLVLLAPALAPALSTTMALRHSSSPALLEQWARLFTKLNEVCLLLVTQANGSREQYDPTPANPPVDGVEMQLPKHPDVAPGGLLLSNREIQIGNLLVTGYAAVNAAAVLGISEHTVRTYIRRLYRKLGVSNRADFVRRYIALVGAKADVASDVVVNSLDGLSRS